MSMASNKKGIAFEKIAKMVLIILLLGVIAVGLIYNKLIPGMKEFTPRCGSIIYDGVCACSQKDNECPPGTILEKVSPTCPLDTAKCDTKKEFKDAEKGGTCCMLRKKSG